MKRSLAFLTLAFSLIPLVTHADDALRRKSVFVEGEDFAPIGTDWRAGEGWADDIYEATSGNAVLANDGGKGEARKDVVIPAEGPYSVWVRYLKIGTYGGTFGLKIEQGGKTVCDEKYRTKPDGGDWRPMWERFEAKLAAGPATLALYIATPGIRQRVDCVLLTPDAKYQPDYRDFAPQTFIRFRLLAPAVPAVPHVNTYIHRAPVYYHDPGDISAGGLGVAGEPVAAGAWSPWCEISRYMDSGRWITTVKLRFFSGGKPLSSVRADIQVAATPEEGAAVTLHEDLDGEISALVLPGDIRKYPEVVSLASALSAQHHAKATGLGLPPLPAREASLPLEMYICGYGDAYRSAKVLGDEMAVARIVGANSVSDWYGVRRQVAEKLSIRRGFLQQWVPYQAWGCPTSAELPKMMDESFAKAAADIRKEDPDALKSIYRNILQDEPGTSDLKHMAGCASCCARFHEFLSGEGFEPGVFGKANWDEVRPIARERATDGPSRRLYYWSIFFRDWANADLVRQGRLAAEKHLGAQITNCVNFTDGALSGWDAGLVSGPDWFLYGRMKATSLMWSEDWASLGPEVSGYIVDMLRAAARPNKLPVGQYIICNSVSTLSQRTFSALMHGAKTLHFYCYGPYYAFADGMVDSNLDVQKTLGKTIRDIGKADEYLYPAQVQPAQVAILYGKSHEIWQQDAAVGTERRTMYLAMQQAHVPVDMVSEQDLEEGVLARYKLLVLTETNVERAAAARIAAWVRSGGVLQMGPGAGMRDEYDEPMAELLDLAGVSAAKLDKPGGDYREHFGIRFQQPRGEVALTATALWPACKLPLLGYQEEAAAQGAEVLTSFADGKPAILRRNVGKGTVLRFAFMPGLGYVKSAELSADKPTVGYKAEQLAVLTVGLKLAKVVSPLEVSSPLVEAQLLRGSKADVVMLANWSGKDVSDLKVTVRDARGVTRVTSVERGAVKAAWQGNALTMSLPLGATDVLVLHK